jgi:hypothetical protein
MSKKPAPALEPVLVRLSKEDLRQLDGIAEAIGGSRAGAMRFLIRQWTSKNPIRPISDR